MSSRSRVAAFARAFAVDAWSASSLSQGGRCVDGVRASTAAWSARAFDRVGARAMYASKTYPAHQVIPFPSLSPTMTRGGIAAWKKEEGEAVAVGDILAEVQTDKAVMEMESMEEGFLAKILVPAGDADDIPVGKAVCVMVEDAVDIAAFADYVAEEAGETATSGADAGAADTGASVPSRAVLERPDYRPIKEQGVPLRNSRAAGRVTSDDSLAAPVARELPADSPRMTVRDALNSALSEEMSRDEKVFIMGEEVGDYQGAYKITKGLIQKFGAERVRDTPITEIGFTGLGVGAAFMGLKPIVEFMTFNFSMQAIDHIVNSAAKTLYMSAGAISAPIVFRGPNGAAAGVGAQHSQCFAAWYMSIPGLKVLAPYDAEDARGLLKAAIRDPDPVVFLENELLYGQEFTLPQEALDEDFVLPIGKAIVMKPGADVTLVAFSKMVGYCLEAAEKLRAEGIDAEVINLRSLRPLDRNALASSVRKTNRLVVVEEGWPQCGVGAEVAAVVNEDAFDHLDAPVERITGVDIPMPYAENLEKMALPTVDDIVRVAKRVCYRD
jgi:pyruvate dehydrogenase E1 component beta subunit